MQLKMIIFLEGFKMGFGSRPKQNIAESASELARKKKEQMRLELQERKSQGKGFRSTILTDLANPGQKKKKLGE